jgi:hypothetical protein
MRRAGPVLLAGACAALVTPARADSPEDWNGLYNARIIASSDPDPAASLAVYDAVLLGLVPDDPLLGEARYWRGRARFDAGLRQLAMDDLRAAAEDDRVGAQARAFLGRLELSENVVRALPYVDDFDDGERHWVRGWPRGRLDDLSVVSLADRGGRVLAWRRVVREAEADAILLAVDADRAPERLQLTVRADAFDARLRILVEDVEGRRWTAPVLQIPADDWLELDLGMGGFVPAEAPASRMRPDGTPIRLVEIRDVSAFHGSERGENRLFFDDVALR